MPQEGFQNKLTSLPDLAKLKKMLFDPDFGTRLKAIEALETLGWQPVVGRERALQYMAHKDFDRAAMEGEEALEPFETALRTGFWLDAKKAAIASARIGTPAVPILAKALCESDDLDVQSAARRTLANIGQPAVPALLDALKRNNIRVNRFAIEALGEIGDPRATIPLVEKLNSEKRDHYGEYPLRVHLAKALADIGDKRALSALFNMLATHSYGDRYGSSISDAITRFGPSVLPDVIEYLEERNWSEHAPKGLNQFLKILGSFRDTRAVPLLIKVLKRGSDSDRSTAALALGGIDNREVVEALIGALNDSYEYTRDFAANSLGKIKDPLAVEPLIARLEDSKQNVRSSATRALGAIGDQRAVVPLIKFLCDRSQAARSSAAEALGILGDSRAVEVLIDSLEDQEKYVRRSSAEGLGALGDVRAVEPLISALKDEDEYVRVASARALGRLKDRRSVKPLTETLKDDSDYMRWTSAESLGKIKDPDAIDALMAALKDPSPTVQNYAGKALEEIRKA